MPKVFPHHLFSLEELRILRKLKTPRKIQDFLNTLTPNRDPKATFLSPRRVLKESRAHCIEGAVLAATALWFQGEKPLLLDLQTVAHDEDHVIALFRQHGCWGALSKTSHAVLRYREPVYHTIHELVMSYFHEYFDNQGRKTLRTYTDPFDLSKIRPHDWLVAEKDIWPLAYALNNAPHFEIMDRKMIAGLRRADAIEIAVGNIVEKK